MPRHNGMYKHKFLKISLHLLLVTAFMPCGLEERRIQSFGGGNLRERDHFEDLGVEEMIIQGASVNRAILQHCFF